MEKVMGQRVLGGVVLVAAATLFLPMVLEGAGVAALQPPEIPAKPAVPSAGDLAPALQSQAAELEKSIADSHGEPTFYAVQPAAPAALETTEDVPDRFHLVEDGAPASTKPASLAVEKATPQPVSTSPAAVKPAAIKPIAEAATKSAPPVKPAIVEKAPEKPTVKVVEKTPLAKPTTPAVEAKAESKPALKIEPKPTVKADAKPDAQGLPSAWVVQVSSVSSKASADELVARLRKRGFRASAAEQGGVFKVSVGPELDRGIAESLKQRLSSDEELKLNGFIAPYRP